MKKYWKRMNQSLVTIKNIQILVEMFKIKNDISSAIVSDIFLPGTEIITTLCNEMTFFTFYTNFLLPSMSWQNLSYLDAKMWNSISPELKLESSLRTFKAPIKLWKPFKTYINDIGFLQFLN